MILGRERIQELAKEADLIVNFDKNCLESAGYDLRVWKVYTIRGRGFIGVSERKGPHIEEIESDIHILKSGEYVLIETLEKVNMPENLVARILPRSTLFRYGCLLLTALVDPGYKGTLTMGLKNISGNEFKFEKGARVAQIVFENVHGKTSPYEGKYQGGNVI